jgi:hypothetical protein
MGVYTFWAIRLRDLSNISAVTLATIACSDPTYLHVYKAGMFCFCNDATRKQFGEALDDPY